MIFVRIEMTHFNSFDFDLTLFDYILLFVLYNNGPFSKEPTFDHLNMGLVWYSDQTLASNSTCDRYS